jgi:glycerol-3-phosphate dehydrogenase
VLARSASQAAAAPVAELLARELGWSDAERERQVCAYSQAVAEERV